MYFGLSGFKSPYALRLIDHFLDPFVIRFIYAECPKAEGPAASVDGLLIIYME